MSLISPRISCCTTHTLLWWCDDKILCGEMKGGEWRSHCHITLGCYWPSDTILQRGSSASSPRLTAETRKNKTRIRAGATVSWSKMVLFKYKGFFLQIQIHCLHNLGLVKRSTEEQLGIRLWAPGVEGCGAVWARSCERQFSVLLCVSGWGQDSLPKMGKIITKII